MIYFTGDMHGELDRFKKGAVRKLKKNDTLIVCGDFGFLWDGSKKEKRRLRWIGRRKYNVLFVEGTHDNLDLLEEYPKELWNGGFVHTISGKLRHLCRGGVFQLENCTLFAFGGGESADVEHRTENWWQGELPTEEEIDAARRNLAAANHQVDVIVTHQCSRKLKKFLTMHDNDANVLDTFFDEVRGGCAFRRWFFGNYHINKVIPPGEYALYNAVVPLDAEKR